MRAPALKSPSSGVDSPPRRLTLLQARVKNKRPMVAKRALIHVLLAFALLLGQQALLAHAATHLAKPPATQDNQLPQHKVCDQCSLSAQFGSALVGKLLSFDPPCGAIDLALHRPQVLYTATPRAFSSRAPPASL